MDWLQSSGDHEESFILSTKLTYLEEENNGKKQDPSETELNSLIVSSPQDFLFFVITNVFVA